MFQGLGNRINVPHNQCIRGTDTFRFIHYAIIFVHSQKEITYTTVVCEVIPHKMDPNFTCINIRGNIIYYPIDVGNPTGFLDLIKIIINSVLSHQHALFINFEIKNLHGDSHGAGRIFVN